MATAGLAAAVDDTDGVIVLGQPMPPPEATASTAAFLRSKLDERIARMGVDPLFGTRVGAVEALP